MNLDDRKWFWKRKWNPQSIGRPLSTFLEVLSRINISQDSFYRPNKALLNTVGFTIHNSDQVFSECHANISTNAREDMPPAMQLEKKAPRKSNVVFDLCDIAAEVKVDIPEEIAEEEVG